MENVKKKKGKGGRPTKPVKKERQASVRFTRAEYFVVNEKAAKAGMRFTAYTRHMAIHGEVVARLTPEQWAYVRRLVGMDNNLNQMVKCAHKEGMFRAMRLFEGFLRDFEEFFKQIRGDK